MINFIISTFWMVIMIWLIFVDAKNIPGTVLNYFVLGAAVFALIINTIAATLNFMLWQGIIK
jgi:hypothetical protein